MDGLDEFSVEQARLSRQEEIAKALANKGGYFRRSDANEMLGRVDQERAAMAQKYQQGLAAEVQRIVQMRQGREAIPAPAEELGGGPAAPTQQADPRAAVQAAMMSQYAPVRRVGDLEYAHQKKADEPYTLKPGEIRKTPGQADVTNSNMLPEHESPLAKLLREKAALPPGSPLAAAYDNAISKTSEVANADRAAPVTAVTIADPKDPNKTIVVDGRTGKKIGDGPKMTETGKMEVGRAFKMQGLGGAIQDAEDLLSGIKRDAEGNPVQGDMPTSSGAGAIADATAGFFGKSLPGAPEAAQLKVIAGKLTSSVPRMEGPQSDKDVALYKQMSGDAGNEKLPLETRLSAVREMKKLYAKYEHMNRDGAGAAPAKDTRPKNPTKPRVVDW